VPGFLHEPATPGRVDLECAESLIQRFISTYLTDKMLRTMRINPKNMTKANVGMKRVLRLNTLKGALSHQDRKGAVIGNGHVLKFDGFM
jgi:hypothetical protein